MIPNSRTLFLCAGAIALSLAFGAPIAFAFGLDDVAHGAEQLAAAPYKKPGDNQPK